MNSKRYRLVCLLLFAGCAVTLAQTPVPAYSEPHRPQIHFTPAAHWMNDPNGLVYLGGKWHLFFQHYPEDIVWGPMHWGHAVSDDLIHWKELPIALYPDSAGFIFSGSAVADIDNTAGFQKNGETPLVAIYTLHDPKGDKAGRNDFETQAIAYSLDSGKTWTKYAGNPVVKNPGIRDFRDPKVTWFKAQRKWIMTLAAQDHIAFYSSPDLKNWKHESDFGKDTGVHDNVWECPDMFTLSLGGKEYWILSVNVNNHAPNNGSGTSYFIGQFNGSAFTPADGVTRWMDYGPDEYAGVTWSNSGDRRIFIGWMSNLAYAGSAPTTPWRSAFTLPRELALVKNNGTLTVTSRPVAELDNQYGVRYRLKDLTKNKVNLSKRVGNLSTPYGVTLKIKNRKSFSFEIANTKGEKVVVGFDSRANRYFIDRTASGKVDFNKNFTVYASAPRISSDEDGDFTMIVDRSSVEIFADKGLTTMTATFFPNEEFSLLYLNNEELKLSEIQIGPIESMWK